MTNSINHFLVDYSSPIYDPFNNGKDDHFLPANTEAKKIIHLSHITQDIHVLLSIIGKLKKPYERKLLEKYMIIEWISLDEHLLSLAKLILGNRTEFSATDDEINEVRKLYNNYKQARKPHYDLMKRIRDKLGAHREQLQVSDVSSLWGAVTSENLIDVLNSAAHFFNFVKDLNIYRWFKVQETAEGEMIAFVQPLILSSKSDSFKLQ